MAHNGNIHFYFYSVYELYPSWGQLSDTQLITVMVITLPPSDVRFSNPQHVYWSLVQLDKHTVEDLAQTEKLQNFADLGAHTIDTGKQMIMMSILSHEKMQLIQITVLIVVSEKIGLFLQICITIVDQSGKEIIIINHITASTDQAPVKVQHLHGLLY